MPQQLRKQTYTFLKELAKNNNRPWFAEHKPRYVDVQNDVKSFMAEVEKLLNKHDMIEGFKVFRIYRDVRFSKNKEPYKTNIGAAFTRATAARRGGFYINLQPGETFIGGGFWQPNPADLKRIRKELEYDAEPFRKILKAKKFKEYFGELSGDQVKTAPKGFSKEHPNIDLIRYKQFLISRTFTDAEACSPSFLKEVDKTYKAMRPFFDFMTQTLTTDENGESII